MIRVFVVDDHAVVRQGLRRILDESAELEFAGEAGSAEDALRNIHKLEWDVMLLDISLPGKNGGDFLKQIINQDKDAKVLILSMHEENQFAVRLMKAGASGYLTKDVAPDRLAEAILRVAGGKKYISPSLAELLLQECSTDSGKPLHAALSDREFQVLLLIGAGKKISEIAKELSLSVKTVSTYRMHILEKMKFRGNPELTHYVIKNGLLQE